MTIRACLASFVMFAIGFGCGRFRAYNDLTPHKVLNMMEVKYSAKSSSMTLRDCVMPDGINCRVSIWSQSPDGRGWSWVNDDGENGVNFQNSL